MSQRGFFLSSGGGGGVVFTLEGNTGGKVPADGTGNINIVGTGDITVTGDAGDNTLTISSSGGASGIVTIDGDTGSITGTTVSFNGQPQAGASVNFSGSGTTMLLNTTDGLANTFVGINSGNTTLSAGNNSGFGQGVLSSLTTGQENTALGNACLGVCTSGSFNLAMGQGLQALVGGERNIALGYGSALGLLNGDDNFIVGVYPISGGGNYTASESSNICIFNEGVGGENNTLRIGTTGTGSAQQDHCFIAGIQGNDFGNASLVTLSGDQLGNTVLTAGSNITITPGAGTLTIDASGGGGSSVVFHSFLNAPITDVTGDGTSYAIPFNDTLVNTGSAFDTGTGAFTAPTTGVYFFNVNMYVQNVTLVNTIGAANFDINSSSFDYTFLDTNFFNCADANGNYALNGSIVLPLTIGDVVVINFAVYNGTKIVGIGGAASSSATSFSGYQIA